MKQWYNKKEEHFLKADRELHWSLAKFCMKILITGTW